jgi:hypothetical protein
MPGGTGLSDSRENKSGAINTKAVKIKITRSRFTVILNTLIPECKKSYSL